MTLAPLAQGFGLTMGLIVAIGAQNAFVLKQGLKKHHPMMIATICILCDCLLIAIGVCGLGYLFEEHPQMMVWFRLVGSSFLFMYGLKSLMSARKASGIQLNQSGHKPKRLTTILALLAFTFLNPHTYLDTIVFIGGTGAQYNFDDQILYVVGAVVASSVWFIGLTYGAAKLAPHFQRARTWQILDFGIGVLMIVMALTLILPLFRSGSFA